MSSGISLSKSERVHEEVIRLARRLSDLVIAKSSVLVSSEMKSLAISIIGLLGDSCDGVLPCGRVFVNDLVIGALYIARGWPEGDFDWTFLGMVSGGHRMNICRSGKEPSVECTGDHGLEPYVINGVGSLWHPTNWTEGTGLSERVMSMMVDKVHKAADSVVIELPEDDDNEFY
jgi:hypothetical protein